MLSSISNILSANNMLSNLLCDTDECLSYILVLLNIFTIFYLVYSSYTRMTKALKIFGYVWSCIMMCSAVFVVFMHTCIFTLLSAVFTAMSIIAVLHLIFENRENVNNKDSKEISTDNKNGCYVIYLTDDNKFTFALYTKSRHLIAKSAYKFNSVDLAKDVIALCRMYGSIADVENLTEDWVLDVKHPKFRLYFEKNYFVDFAVNHDVVLLKSDAIDSIKDALHTSKDAVKCVNSKDIYFATDKNDVLDGNAFKDVDKPLNKLLNPNFKEEEKQEVVESIEIEESPISLSQSLKNTQGSNTSLNINKQVLLNYLFNKYNNEVMLVSRDNETSTGLPLADTYYTYINFKNDKKDNKKVCFAYVYEKGNGVLILARLDRASANKFKQVHKNISLSAFPKSVNNDWYSFAIDNSYNTNEEVYEILETSKEYVDKFSTKK